MADINPGTMGSIFTGYNTAFNEGMADAPDEVSDIASEFSSSGEDQIYPWLLGLGQMDEWVDEKEHEDLAAVSYRLTNKDWAKGFELKRSRIEDDLYGVYTPAARMLGRTARDLPNVQVNNLLQSYTAGTDRYAWDGKRFFATDHPVNPFKGDFGAYSNLRTATPLSRANLVAMRAAFMQFKGPDGVQLGVPPDLLLVHPNQEVQARELVQAAFLPGVTGSGEAGSRSNVITDLSMKVRVLNRSTEDGVWYLAATRAGKRVMFNPLIVQVRKRPMFISQTAPNDEKVYTQGIFRYSAEARYAFGYGIPSQMMRMEPT